MNTKLLEMNDLSNVPKQIYFASGSVIKHMYNTGKRIPCEVTTVDYCGDFIYVNGTLKRMLFPGGYMTFTNDDINQPEYHFYITDHQGNVRVVANQSHPLFDK
ncbi:hypothetical protein [Prevotella sp. Rep29]|uniref:hypothetical protein n=1 Tax=Prevotella sp. Rep29 TaxID=2691580 RepID=UPI001C6E27DD|nr:hypothetical protein [Prevotella sp. Rep29]QYR10258.1 hypothetical protein GRF55_03670 [Prevotella sp. Rep29]